MSVTLDQSLNDALSSMSASEIASFSNGQLGELTSSMSNNLANAFIPAMNISIDSANNYDILTNYTINSRNLNTTVADLKDQQTKNLNIANQNLSNSNRVREIRDWYYNNKLDTLFVFQLIFISLSLLGFVAYLMKAGIIGAGVFGALVGLLAVVLILTIANRAVYTDKARDKRYWSKRLFGVLGSPLPGGLVEQKCA